MVTRGLSQRKSLLLPSGPRPDRARGLPQVHYLIGPPGCLLLESVGYPIQWGLVYLRIRFWAGLAPSKKMLVTRKPPNPQARARPLDKLDRRDHFQFLPLLTI